jgi:hypothetical protein
MDHSLDDRLHAGEFNKACKAIIGHAAGKKVPLVPQGLLALRRHLRASAAPLHGFDVDSRFGFCAGAATISVGA